MCSSGYTLHPSFLPAREYGYTVINEGLKLTLADEDGKLDERRTGERMVRNYETLCLRKGLIGELACRPSRLGDRKVLVVHGTEDEAVSSPLLTSISKGKEFIRQDTEQVLCQYPFDRDYHSRTASALGEANAEVFVVQGGPHFVTATHWELVDKKIDEWIRRHFVK
ncbi:hypothetical protein P7C70_g8897, partial [Phenoliferia sp. Uapishka_3]